MLIEHLVRDSVQRRRHTQSSTQARLCGREQGRGTSTERGEGRERRATVMLIYLIKNDFLRL